MGNNFQGAEITFRKEKKAIIILNFSAPLLLCCHHEIPQAVALSLISLFPETSAWCMVLPSNKYLCDEEGKVLLMGGKCAKSNLKVHIVETLLSIRVMPNQGTLNYY